LAESSHSMRLGRSAPKAAVKRSRSDRRRRLCLPFKARANRPVSLIHDGQSDKGGTLEKSLSFSERACSASSSCCQLPNISKPLPGGAHVGNGLRSPQRHFPSQLSYGEMDQQSRPLTLPAALSAIWASIVPRWRLGLAICGNRLRDPRVRLRYALFSRNWTGGVRVRLPRTVSALFHAACCVPVAKSLI